MTAKWEKRGNPIRRFFDELINGKPELWPRPQLSGEPDPVFLFVLTTPYSGSTALAKILDTSQHGMTLNDSGEGQWLVPGLRQLEKWHEDMYVDWQSVRAVWLERFQEARRQNNQLRVVIEKSPANLVRAAQFAENFPTASFLGFTRNPYACCASIFHRRWDPRNSLASYRNKKFKQIAGHWARRTRLIRDFVEPRGIEWFTYEQFCADTAGCVAKINKACPDLEGIDPQGKVKVKNYKVQKITNQNPRQLAMLKPADIDAINSALTEHADLMSFYGYELID
ncbi:MAG: sulfotransferase [Gammaproteobacteria bacterium]